MKKYLTIFIAILLLVMLVSCGNDSNDTSAPNAGDGSAAESERTIITLGTLAVWYGDQLGDIMRHVWSFNAESRDYRIEVIVYTHDDLARLRTELVTGTGPDIIHSFFFDDSILVPMINRGIFVDLWPFIDADPDINREDFFQNILELSQRPDGSLPLIANSFTIETLISLPETVEHLESFTPTDFIATIRNALDTGVSHPLGGFVTGSGFISHMLSFVDFGFLDFDAGVSNFESQAFYDLLEVASLLPEEAETDLEFSLFGEYARLARREQPFKFETIFSLPISFAPLKTLLGDFTYLGYPSDDGGIHGALMYSYLGINADSNNPDAAWSFIRRYLLPDPDAIHMGIPIRIDLYEEQVREATSAKYFTTTEDGELIGMLEWPVTVDGIEVPVRALTEDDVKEFGNLIESVSFKSRINRDIVNIVMEEVAPFLAGTRTAEETARVIQSRVQMYLHERS